VLTIQLLVKNNESTIREALASLSPLDAEIRVADLGCKDESIEICEAFGAKIYGPWKVEDYSSIRNRLLGDDWNFYIHPWEKLVSGYDSIREAIGSCYFDVYRGKAISREIRLWRNLHFSNPIYETLTDNNATKSKDGIIWSGGDPQYPNAMKFIERWEQNTSRIEPHYYHAWELLREGQFESFEIRAKHYLSLDSKSKSAVMLRYHLARVQLYILKKAEESAQNILFCIADQPLMAEFWCLLGDIYYSQSNYKTAKELYENGKILGTKRFGGDLWPIEIEKYAQYPEQMIQSCNELLRSRTLIGSPTRLQ